MIPEDREAGEDVRHRLLRREADGEARDADASEERAHLEAHLVERHEEADRQDSEPGQRHQKVAQRLVRYAEIVGRERVIAGTDCGFATFARSVNQVEPEIAWAKFKAMAEGARLASAQLWP